MFGVAGSSSAGKLYYQYTIKHDLLKHKDAN
jgi:hypothetical protein